MTPSIVWGLGIGLVIALVDVVATILTVQLSPAEWPVQDIDMFISVALYSLIGFRVGMATGVVREAAEGGVMAGILASSVVAAITWLLPALTGGFESTWEIVYLVSFHVALGGALGIVTGWMGARAIQNDIGSRR